MIGNTIKALRESVGISQAALAKELRVTRSSVNAWEMGLSIPTTQYIVEMSKYFCVSVDYLLGLTDRETLVLDNLTEDEKHAIRAVIQCFIKRRERG